MVYYRNSLFVAALATVTMCSQTFGQTGEGKTLLHLRDNDYLHDTLIPAFVELVCFNEFAF